MFYMYKKGMSNVVASVLVILIVVVAVAVVWQIVIPMVADVGVDASDVELTIMEAAGYTVYDPDTKLASVQIKRGDDDVELLGIEVVFTVDGNSIPFVVPADKVPEPGSYKMNKFNLSIYGEPDFVEVFPIVDLEERLTVLQPNVIVPITGNVVRKVELKIGTVEADDDVIDSIEELSRRASQNIVGGGMMLMGDINGDCDVDGDDLEILVENWGLRNRGPEHGDLNGDGKVDMIDFIMLKANIGLSCYPDCRKNKMPVVDEIFGNYLGDASRTSLLSKGVVYGGVRESVIFDVEDDTLEKDAACKVDGPMSLVDGVCDSNFVWAPTYSGGLVKREPVEFSFVDDGRFTRSGIPIFECEKTATQVKNMLICPEPEIVGVPSEFMIVKTVVDSGETHRINMLVGLTNDGYRYTGSVVYDDRYYDIVKGYDPKRTTTYDVELEFPCDGYGWSLEIETKIAGEVLSSSYSGGDVCGLREGYYLLENEDWGYKEKVIINGGTNYVAFSGTDCSDVGIEKECVSGDVKPCEKQGGVCLGSTQICGSDGKWPGCSTDVYREYNIEYVESEVPSEIILDSCFDGIDNDCDGDWDCADWDCEYERYGFDDTLCRMCYHGIARGPNKRPEINSVRSRYTGEYKDYTSLFGSKKALYLGVEESFSIYKSPDESDTDKMTCEIYKSFDGEKTGDSLGSVDCDKSLLWTPNDKDIKELVFEVVDDGSVSGALNDVCRVESNKLSDDYVVGDVKVCPKPIVKSELREGGMMGVKFEFEDGNKQEVLLSRVGESLSYKGLMSYGPRGLTFTFNMHDSDFGWDAKLKDTIDDGLGWRFGDYTVSEECMEMSPKDYTLKDEGMSVKFQITQLPEKVV